MTRRLRFLGIWGVVLAFGGGRAGAGSPSTSVVPVPGDATQSYFAFRVDASSVQVSPGAEGAVVRVSGFRAEPRAPGVPDLPFEPVRIAIPPGTTPRLEIRELVEDVIPGVRPRAVGREIAALAPDALEDGALAATRDGIRREVARRTVREEDPSAYRTTWPASVARLGESGWLRDQRFVEVVLTPVRWDPRARGLRAARSYEVVVHFDGDTGERFAPREDPRWESIFRSTFTNYSQGATFRESEAPSSALHSSPVTIAATGPTYKIKVRQNGVVRLDSPRMAGTGIETQLLSTWAVTNREVEVPLQVHDGNGNDMLDPGDWVQFYGQALTDEPKTSLNYDVPGSTIDIFEYRDFADDNVYFVFAEAGLRARMADRSSAPTFSRTPPNDFEAAAHFEIDDAWRPLAGADPWYSLPTLTSGTGGASRTDSISLPGLASGTAPARVLVNVRGVSENLSLSPDHHTRVTLQNATNQTLATNDDNGTFDGRTIYLHDFTWPGTGGTLTSPAKVVVEARPISAGNHQVILDYAEIRYRRLFQASGDALAFDWPDGDAEFVVSGFATVPEIFETTARIASSGVADTVRVTAAQVTGTGPFTVRFRMDNDPGIADGTSRHFVLAGAGASAVPANPDFVADVVSDLRNNAIQADIVVIAHPTALGAASQATLTQLLNWRTANQGLTSKVAMIDDVYDEFNDGLPGPDAIRSFLAWVMSTQPGEGWASPKPSYVLLLGDGSYDYKAGTTNGNLVPTAILLKDDPSFGYYASDDALATVVGGDRIPDLVIGRLPARTDAELNVILTKLLNYAQAPPVGTWRKHALAMSDRGKNFSSSEAEEFEATNQSGLDLMKTPPHSYRNLRFWTDYCGGTAGGCTPGQVEAMRSAIKASVNGTDGFADGAAIAQFTGHGNFDVWSDEAFFDDRIPNPDTDDLTNGGRLPLMFIHNCLSGGFMSTATRSLGEDWVKKSGGGALAVYSPSGLANGYFGQTATNVIWNAFFGPRKERRLSVPVFENWLDLCGVDAIEACQGYVLLGDPATDVVFPSVSPATSVQATGGNTQVSLAWTAAAGASTYDVWRALSTSLTYTKAGSTSGTNFTDPGLENAKTYRYYVVALDSSGFESRWSNFNSDCDVSGPDCVEATPLNPNPPGQPTGLAASDPETGGKLNLSWNPNSEADLKQYEVRYGTSPGSHPNIVANGKSTTASLSGLQNGVPYYIVITATNTSNNTSAPSLEVSATPTFVRGTKSPAFITTLRIDKSGSDAALSWNAVTTDIYGKPETVTKYEIFRGATPDFLPGPGNKIGETTGTTFPDVNALDPVAPNYHWLVRAVDTDGNVGGLGYQLPNGIDLLTVAKSGTTPGNLVLSWPAVTTAFDGTYTRIDHYELYAAATPFTRAQVNGMSPLLSTSSTSIEITPTAGTQYYSIVVVDTRGNKSSF